MTVAPDLLDILVCPEAKKPMYYFADEGALFCPESRLRYKIDDGIPIMLIEDAERLSESAAAELVAEAKKRKLPLTGTGGIASSSPEQAG